jgi:glycogen debranching enzyme
VPVSCARRGKHTGVERGLHGRNVADSLLLLEGSRFWISDGRGDAVAGTHGLLDTDVRHLSVWRLFLDDNPLHLLSSRNLSLTTARIFGTVIGDHLGHNPSLTVMREQSVASFWAETIVVENHLPTTHKLQLILEFAADFADVFEMRRGGLQSSSKIARSAEGVALSAREGEWQRSSVIGFDQAFSLNEKKNRVTFDVALVPNGRWKLSIDVSGHGHNLDERGPSSTPVLSPVADFAASAPAVKTDSEVIVRTYKRSLADLAALRFFPDPDQALCVPAAGLPWFMALFGRDSIIAAFQALPFAPDLARSTLLSLARHQSSEDDPYRDAEPGKILHELRRGKLAALGRVPHTPYYGSHDATPLFLVLLDEYEYWSRDEATVAQMKSPALRAMQWMETSGDPDGDGYLEYRTRSSGGLVNHCWKDSANSIAFANGELAKPPIATCDIQGYAYDARLRMARLCREFWNEPELAARLEADADILKRRFNVDFWCPERRHFALALDGDKRRVDSLTSNTGHLLWSGIVDDEHVEATIRRLMDPEMFSGWGIRTMSTADAAYNPIGYHTGTVWPHDSGLVAEGMRRYGHRQDATRLAWALFECAGYFAYRLPEVFGGFARADTQIPVEYPTASRPQAWAAGAPLLALRTILGLDADGEHRPEPCLPAGVRELGLIDPQAR